MDVFTTDVYPIFVYHATRAFRDPELQQEAIEIAYLSWTRNPEISPKSLIFYAVKHVRAGRTVSHLGKLKRWGGDPLDHAWRCGGMGEAMDRGTGPLAAAIAKEELAIALQGRNEQQREALQLAAEGWTTEDIAAIVGFSPARVSQLRRRAYERNQG